MSKTTQLQQLLTLSKGEEAHRDSKHLLSSSSDSPPFSTSNYSFRSSAASSSSDHDPEFAQFASSSSSQYSPLVPSFTSSATPWALFPDGQRRSQPPIHSQDGSDVLALLSTSNSFLSDAIDGDWEATLFADRGAQSWRTQQEEARPIDPLPLLDSDYIRTGNGDGKGKGKARAGSVSPVSAELISSLSHLDLASRTYLQSFLALPTDESVAQYLKQGSYTEDVYGLPDGLRRLFEKAQSEEGREGLQPTEEGKKKALRRLQMVMRHFMISNSQPSPSSTTFPTADATATTPSPSSSSASFPSPTPFLGTPSLLNSSSHRLLSDNRTNFSSSSSPDGQFAAGPDFRVVDSPQSATSSFSSASAIRTKTTDDLRLHPLFGIASRATTSSLVSSKSIEGEKEKVRGEPWGKTDGEGPHLSSSRLSSPTSQLSPLPFRNKQNEFDNADDRLEEDGGMEPFSAFMDGKLKAMSSLFTARRLL